jgi:hypothetical protein
MDTVGMFEKLIKIFITMYPLHVNDLHHQLKRRGYNDKAIESGFSKASEIDRNDLLEYKEKNINKRVPLVLTYHPSLENISIFVLP